MSLTPDDLQALDAMFQRGLAPIGERLTALETTLPQRLRDLELAVAALSEVSGRGFRQLGDRIAALGNRIHHLEERMGALEERTGRLIGDTTRGRTTDSERITALEARVTELEARLGVPR